MTKIFWKEIAEDYATPLIHPFMYMLGTSTDKFKKMVGVRYLKPTLWEYKKEIIREIKFFPKIEKAISKYTKNYDWIQFHYAGPTILDKKYFVKILANYVKQEIDAQEELNKINQRNREVSIDQKKIITDLNLSKKGPDWQVNF